MPAQCCNSLDDPAVLAEDLRVLMDLRDAVEVWYKHKGLSLCFCGGAVCAQDSDPSWTLFVTRAPSSTQQRQQQRQSNNAILSPALVACLKEAVAHAASGPARDVRIRIDPSLLSASGGSDAKTMLRHAGFEERTLASDDHNDHNDDDDSDIEDGPGYYWFVRKASTGT